MLRHLQELSHLSNLALQASKNGLWDEAQDIQSQREALIAQIIKLPMPEQPEQINEIRDLSQTIRKVDEHLALLANTQKEEIFTQIKSANRSKKMTKAYQAP